MDHDLAPLPIDLYAAARGMAYLATLLLIGACAFAALLPRWRDPEDDDQSLAAQALQRTWEIARWAGALLVVAHLGRGYGQVRSFLEPFEPFTWEAARPILVETAWGNAWLAQLAVAMVVLLLALLSRQRPTSGLALLGTAVLAAAVATPLTGHATEHPWGRELGLGLHTLHLVGGGLWLGSLGTMLFAGLYPAAGRRLAAVRRAEADRGVARMVRAFSPLALTGATIAISTGGLLAIAYVGNLSSLWTSSYGRVLLAKLGLLVLTLGFGAWNWRRLSPGLGTTEATTQLTRSATIELLIASLLLSVTALLVALPAPNLAQ